MVCDCLTVFLSHNSAAGWAEHFIAKPAIDALLVKLVDAWECLDALISLHGLEANYAFLFLFIC